MTTVYLYGALGRRFGHRWSLDVQSPAEAVRAIAANRRDFLPYLTSHSLPGYQVFLGADVLTGADHLHDPAGRQAIKIVPVVTGGAKSPVIGIIIGVVLIIAAVVSFQWYAVPLGLTAAGALTATGSAVLAAGFIGAGLVVSGLTTLLTNTPSATVQERPENTPSAIFNGPVNTTVAGHPVPIGYGTLRVGSAVVSASIVTKSQII